jgi:hypothetical protein
LKEKTKEQMSLRERTLVYAQPADIDALFNRKQFQAHIQIGPLIIWCMMHSCTKPYAPITVGLEEDRGLNPPWLITGMFLRMENLDDLSAK